MNYLEVTRVVASQAAWRITGLDVLGRSLVRALDSEDETCRTIAGMCLTRAGERAEHLLLEALPQCNDVALVISVLGGIGDPKLVSYLQPFRKSSDQAVSEAAAEAIRVIEGT